MTTYFSKDIVDDILAHAAALQAYEEKKKYCREHPALLSHTLGEKELYETLCEIGKLQNIDPSFIDRTLSLRYPSTVQQGNDLRRFSGKPLLETLALEYAQTFEQALCTAFPHKKIRYELLSMHDAPESFAQYRDALRQTQWHMVIGEDASVERRQFYFLKKTSSKFQPYAFFLFQESEGMYSYTMRLSHPLFLSICGDLLEKVDEKHKAYVQRKSLLYDYPVPVI